MSDAHILEATTKTVHWGYFDAAQAPAATINSGDTITINTVSGGPDVVPDGDFHIPPELHDIHATVPRKLPGHILTGPVHVSGAKAGHVLQVDILEVSLRQDWGYNFIRPGAGGLPDDFTETSQMTIRLHADSNEGELPWGKRLPLRPFFGVMGCAPPADWGAVSSIQPRAHGGNMDNKELIPGATLYLPIFVDGALFSAGDGHACQGDGEVCVTAIETALQGVFRLTVRADMQLSLPQAEDAENLITMAFNEDLDEAAKDALRQMLDVITARTNLTREQAYSLCSLTADLRITQIVNGNKGVHVVLPKSAL
tara:strand:- start:964 stop:1899 length:936 start_codon:yes stop_codon:yes gene_type:complete